MFRPMMLDLVVGGAGHHEHVTPPPFESVCPRAHMDGEGSITIYIVSIILPVPSGSGFYSRCKARDRGPGYMTACGLMPEAQVGTLNNFWVVRYGAPCQSQTGVIITNVGQEAPCRFSGYSMAALVIGDPHTPGL